MDPAIRYYAAIDLKSFYASVECHDRGLDPLTTNLVVAEVSRTEKTICLAVSPSLKAYGIPGRARLFEVVQAVKRINDGRLGKAPERRFCGSSYDAKALAADPSLSLDYIAATPRMALYMEVSTRIYDIYLRHVAPEDMHVYSVDEVFLDLTDYLRTGNTTPREMVKEMIREVFEETGISATAGIGTNLYLAKIAMDIYAKHIEADRDGVRIAELDELSYRKHLWTHRPLTDFWRVGKGYVRKLESHGMFTMGDIARCSLGGDEDFFNEELLYRLFGVNAELLIDHAWGVESCTMKEIHAYQPMSRSLTQGQVLSEPYDFEKGRLIVREMTEMLALELVEKRVVTDQVVLTVGYDTVNVTDPERRARYQGEIVANYYGKEAPKSAHGSENLSRRTSSTRLITEAMMRLYDRIVNPDLLIRRLNVVANHILTEEKAKEEDTFRQLELFRDYGEEDKSRKEEEKNLERERRMQEAVLSLKKKFGKNAVLRGSDLCEGATAIQRNSQVGGHRA